MHMHAAKRFDFTNNQVSGWFQQWNISTWINRQAQWHTRTQSHTRSQAPAHTSTWLIYIVIFALQLRWQVIWFPLLKWTVAKLIFVRKQQVGNGIENRTWIAAEFLSPCFFPPPYFSLLELFIFLALRRFAFCFPPYFSLLDLFVCVCASLGYALVPLPPEWLFWLISWSNTDYHI